MKSRFDSPVAIGERGLAEEGLGLLVEAADDLRSAARRDPNEKDWTLALARVAKRLSTSPPGPPAQSGSTDRSAPNAP